MMHALVLTWWLSLGYPYTPQSRLWLESGGAPSYGKAWLTGHRPSVWVKIEWN